MKEEVPCQLDEGACTCSTPAHFPTNCKTHYCQLCFKALDLAFSTIQDRFDQRHSRIYCHLEELLLQTVRGESTQGKYEFVCQFYMDDFDKQRLQLHLETLQAIFPEDMKSATLCIKDLKQLVLSLSKIECMCSHQRICYCSQTHFDPSLHECSE